ncbi:hypothetical protein HEP87_01405 [Streptomyces sp. S1D4-11]|nr:hypothetical protein [Streptomyces sp. S1D4-11]QIY93113.1 hypothetical protein HEP87_01405 [Streptomyces sp. S1D4-11]
MSYMLVAGMAAAALAMWGRVRMIAAVILLAILLTLMVTSHTIWDLGHIIASVWPSPR